jgi:hypothetical protein
MSCAYFTRTRKLGDMTKAASKAPQRNGAKKAPGVGQEDPAADGDAKHVVAYFKLHWKEIVALATGVVTTISGAIVWVVTYFATQEYVTRMECMLSSHISIQAIPLELALIKFQLDETASAASSLEGKLKVSFDPEMSRLYAKLTNDRKRLEDRQAAATKELDAAKQQQRDCIKDAKVAGKKQP